MSSQRPSRRWRIGRFAARCVVGILLLSTLAVLPWRWLAPPTTAFMLREGWFGGVSVEYEWVDWDAMSSHLAIAAVAAEDQKFPLHRGFDLDAIAQAWSENRSGGVRGASTITQQVAKNLYLWPARSYVRKGLEAYFTVWIEALWPKRRILEVYLNVAEFGPGVFGVAAASRRAFGKPAATLTLAEAATLVAVLPSPRGMSLTAPSDYVRRRADQIAAATRQLGGPAYLAGLAGE